MPFYQVFTLALTAYNVIYASLSCMIGWRMEFNVIIKMYPMIHDQDVHALFRRTNI